MHEVIDGTGVASGINGGKVRLLRVDSALMRPPMDQGFILECFDSF